MGARTRRPGRCGGLEGGPLLRPALGGHHGISPRRERRPPRMGRDRSRGRRESPTEPVNWPRSRSPSSPSKDENRQTSTGPEAATPQPHGQVVGTCRQCHEANPGRALVSLVALSARVVSRHDERSLRSSSTEGTTQLCASTAPPRVLEAGADQDPKSGYGWRTRGIMRRSIVSLAAVFASCPARSVS
jgi:hypothetical protein